MNLIEVRQRASKAYKEWKASWGGNNGVAMKARLDEARRAETDASFKNYFASFAAEKVARTKTSHAKTVAPTSTPVTVPLAIRAELPIAQVAATAAASSTTAVVNQADIDARVASIRQNAGLDPQPQSEEVIRIRRNAGLDPQPRSAEVTRIRQNAGLDPQPRSPELVRILGNTTPSMLTAAERQSLMSPDVIRILGNFQRASGAKVLPLDIEAAKSCKPSR